MKRTSM